MGGGGESIQCLIGFVGLQYNEEWSEGEHKTEVGWRLDRACWNRGLATEGARASLGYGFEMLELERIISFTVPENAASRRVMEKCGLVRRGETRWRGLITFGTLSIAGSGRPPRTNCRRLIG